MLIYGTMDEQTEDKLSDFVVDMNLKYDTVFSVIDIEFENFKKMNVRKIKRTVW